MNGKVMRELIGGARGRDSGNRDVALQSCVDAYLESKDRHTREFLLTLAKSMLLDAEALARSAAIEVIGEFGDLRDYRAAVVALGDESWVVRASGYSAIAAIGGKRSVARLLKGLRDPNAIVRRCVAQALSDTLGEAAVPHLRQAMARDGNRYSRVGYLRGLARFGDREALAELKVAAESEDPWISSPARRAIGELPGSPR